MATQVTSGDILPSDMTSCHVSLTLGYISHTCDTLPHVATSCHMLWHSVTPPVHVCRLDYDSSALLFPGRAGTARSELRAVYRVGGGPPNSADTHHSRRPSSGYCTRQCRAHNVFATCVGLPTHCTRPLYVWHCTACLYSCQEQL